jgi:hypothetical protein
MFFAMSRAKAEMPESFAFRIAPAPPGRMTRQRTINTHS